MCVCVKWMWVTTALLLLQGLHPRIVAEGFEKAREKALEVGWVY